MLKYILHILINLLHMLMDVCLKNKYIWVLFQYIPIIYLIIKYNMHLYNMA